MDSTDKLLAVAILCVVWLVGMFFGFLVLLAGCGAVPEARMMDAVIEWPSDSTIDSSADIEPDEVSDCDGIEPEIVDEDVDGIVPWARYDCVCYDDFGMDIVWEFSLCVPPETALSELETWIAPIREECARVRNDWCRCGFEYCEPAGECISQ